MRVSYILFPSETHIKDVIFDEIKAKNYFLEHKRDFLQPAAINIAYLKFSFKENNEDSKNSAYEKVYAALDQLQSGMELVDVAQKHTILYLNGGEILA